MSDPTTVTAEDLAEWEAQASDDWSFAGSVVLRLIHRVRELEADGERLDYLEKHWARHGTVSHLRGLRYAIWYADWEWDESRGDKYEHPVGEGDTLRAAIDTARGEGEN